MHPKMPRLRVGLKILGAKVNERWHVLGRAAAKVGAIEEGDAAVGPVRVQLGLGLRAELLKRDFRSIYPQC